MGYSRSTLSSALPRSHSQALRSVRRSLQKWGGFDSLGLSLADASPMSRRDLSQASFVDAMVSGYGKVGGFLDRIEQWFDWSAFEDLLSPIHGSATGVPGYPPLTMSRSFFCSNGIRSLIRAPRRRCAIGCRSAAFAACRWRWRRPTTPRSGDFAKRSTSLACRRSSWPRSTGSSMRSASSSSAARLIDATIIAGAVRRP